MTNKIEQAKAASDKIADAFITTKEILGTCFVNGHGILADPSLTRQDLAQAKAAILEALAIYDATDWPRSDELDDADR
ncbi:hypothetical protein J2857_006171 [Neorhizobium galegae]|uniref:hypothetical protein n=1 Tax=Neorhizobium galegae TaxID=399 RepID=UPI001AE25B82|nr:hypothetical protein [Neorhizobium galegae]MBP2563372.1 hypothetical protein [Neorhizobium galegae]